MPNARGVAPGLSLAYSSGNGNGHFGLGFSLAVDAVSRKTSTGIPKYDGTDTYILGSDGELTPAYQPDGGDGWKPDAQQWTSPEGINWRITAYRPRVEGSHDRIEQWEATETQEVHWRVVTSANVTHLYGNTANSRIFDPENPLHVFEWLISETRDAHGNLMVYRYRAEDGEGIPTTIYNEGRNHTTQRYLWQVAYGNYMPPNGEGLDPEYNCAFAYQVCLDYGQMDWDNPNAAWGEWTCRPDPFSTYKAGFEIRTWRRCRGIFLRQHFTEENNGQPFISQATLIHYTQSRHSNLSLVQRVWQRGYRLQPNENPWMEESPAMELDYQDFLPEAHTWKPLEADAPGYLGEQGFMSVDIYGEGMDGLLWSNDSYTGYLRPLGKGKFAPAEPLPHFPNFKDVQGGPLTFTSVEGNSVLDLVVNAGSQSGYFAAREEGGWNAFSTFPHLPEDFSNPAKEWVDINGSGKPAILLYDNGHLKTYPSAGKLGYGDATYTQRPSLFPGTNAAGETEALTYADVFGDGLPHRVRIRNGCLEAWPCLGHGCFGERVTFGNSPVFDGEMDVARLHLVDTDGSGAMDVVYVTVDRLQVWINQNGNSFADPVEIPLPSAYGSLSQLTPGDFTGYGTASLLLTQAVPQITHQYYDFCGSHKPYLLRESRNGMGGSTQVRYTTSVLEYLRDQQEGRRWPTQLPFPVHVTQQVTIRDATTGSHFSQRFRYHDGYFDPIEREFRGFGYVESWDTEQYEEFKTSSTLPEKAADLLDKNLWVPPVHTKSWFLTGAYARTPEILAAYQREFFHGDPDAWHIPEFELGETLHHADADTLQQAYAAIAGHNIRTEVYALDGSGESENPYTIAQSSVKLRLVQPRLTERYCSIEVLDSQSLSYSYERNPADPQITQSLVLATDEYGNPLFNASVSYPRRNVAGQVIYPEQQALRCVVSRNDYINSVNPDTDSPLDFWELIGVNWQGRSYEIGGIEPPDQEPFTPESLAAMVAQALQNPLSQPPQTPPTQPWSRLLGWERSNFWNADQTAPLQGGEITPQALLYGNAAAVVSTAQLDAIFGDKVSTDLMQCQGGYHLEGDHWWNPGLVQYYLGAAQYYLPYKTEGPSTPNGCPDAGLSTCTEQVYDPYLLFPIETITYLSPTVTLQSQASVDYQALQPWQLVDANGMTSEVAFDPLGRVLVATLYGDLVGNPVGDDPISAYTYQPGATFDSVIQNPRQYLQGMTQYFYYDLHAWQDKEHPQPVNAIALQRMEHVHNAPEHPELEGKSLIQTAITFSDGLGNILQAKSRTGPGPITLRKGKGTILNPQASEEADMVQERWLVTGRVVYNNKGQPTEQYEPFFSAQPQFESQQEIIDQGWVPPPGITQYDPLGRAVKATTPKGFFSKTTFTPWQSQLFDPNDTVVDSAYYEWFTSTYPTPTAPWEVEEQAALDAAVMCYDTPSTTILDNLGRAIRGIVDNLGAVGQGSIPSKVATPFTPQTLWQSLVSCGYLVPDAKQPDIAWVSPTFQPYTPGFHETFLQQYPDNGPQVEAWLAQQCLTSMAVYDIQGNVLASADPRLFAEMLHSQEAHFNFEYAYDMMGTPLFIRSADAGEKWSLGNIFGNNISTWDSRGFQVSKAYDNLQRPTQVTVTGGDGETPLDSIVEVMVYGETLVDPQYYNLNGRLYQHYDQSGLVTAELYGLGGQVLQSTRQVRPDYKTEANWTTENQGYIQEVPKFAFSTRYNAIGGQVLQVLPDESRLRYLYNVGGRLLRMGQEISDEGGTMGYQMVEEVLGYDANGQRTLVRYGNGLQSRFTYDAMTQQLVAVQTTRPNPDGNGVETLRAIQYTYDPVGNTISQLDRVAEVQYGNNQQVIPKNTYTYDPLYRLTTATGRTLPSLTQGQPGSKIVEAMIGHHYSPISDLQNMENYTRQFAYDAGGNLVLQRHMAKSGNWTQLNVVTHGSNRLQTQAYGNPSDQTPLGPDLPYDANGNLLKLYPGSKATVAWNYRDNVSSVTQITRAVDNEDGEALTLNDAEYYLYDASGSRRRKVTERMQQGGTLVWVTDKLYFGEYEVKRSYTRPVANPEPTTVTLVSEVHSIHASEGDRTITITDVWVMAPNKEKGPQTGDLQTRYLLHDPLGSVTLELTATAEVMSLEEYYPYGGTSFTLARSQLEADAKEYRFCGKECDAATGLYYYGARYYATWLCRWMSPDPAGTVDGPNLYAYVKGNPIRYNDPTGMGSSDEEEYKPGDEFKSKREKRKRSVPRQVTSTKKKKTGKKDSDVELIPAEYQQSGDETEVLVSSDDDRSVLRSAKRKLGTFDPAATSFDPIQSSGFSINFGYQNNAPYLTFPAGKSPAARLDAYYYNDRGSKVQYKRNSTQYVSLLRVVKKKQSGVNVARALRTGRLDILKSETQRQAAHMLLNIVGMAEEWRKTGAVRLFTSILEAVENRELSFSQIEAMFQFIDSADAGRKMVGRFIDVLSSYKEDTILSDDEKVLLPYMRKYDWEEELMSDIEMTTKKSIVTAPRIFSDIQKAYNKLD